MTRPAIILTLAIALLAACAAPGVNRSAANFNESKFTVDLNLCRGGNIAEASLRTIGKGAVGSPGRSRYRCLTRRGGWQR